MFVYNQVRFNTEEVAIVEDKFFRNNEIWGFIPEYLRNIGETTRVIVYKGDDHLIPITLKSFKRNMCKYYSIDYESSRKKFGKLIGTVNCVPLPINTDKVFLQLKVRKPKFKGDAAMGYIDLYSIKDFKTDKNTKETEIILKDGRSVKVLYKASTIHKHIKNARLIIDSYRKERRYTEYPETLETLYASLDKPATKADIAILTREIATLKNSLKVY